MVADRKYSRLIPVCIYISNKRRGWPFFSHTIVSRRGETREGMLREKKKRRRKEKKRRDEKSEGKEKEIERREENERKKKEPWERERERGENEGVAYVALVNSALGFGKTIFTN